MILLQILPFLAALDALDLHMINVAGQLAALIITNRGLIQPQYGIIEPLVACEAILVPLLRVGDDLLRLGDGEVGPHWFVGVVDKVAEGFGGFLHFTFVRVAVFSLGRRLALEVGLRVAE